MFQQGFLVLFQPSERQPLQACPVLAMSAAAAAEAFARDRGAAHTGQEVLLTVLSLSDLERHRRSLLELAATAGRDLHLQA